MSDSTSIERIDANPGMRDWLSGIEEGDMSPSRIVAVMLLGALGSLACYYIYSSLAPDTRDDLKEQLVNSVKTKINQLTRT